MDLGELEDPLHTLPGFNDRLSMLPALAEHHCGSASVAAS